MKEAVIKAMELDNMTLLKLASLNPINLKEIKVWNELGFIDLTKKEKEFIEKTIK